MAIGRGCCSRRVPYSVRARKRIGHQHSRPERGVVHGRLADRLRGPDDRARRLRCRDGVRVDAVHPDAKPSGPLVDVRRLERDLGDVQDLPLAAGQVPRRPVDPDRGLHRVLLLRALGPDGGARRRHPPRVDPRHTGELRRGLVWHPHQHGRQFAHGVLRAPGQHARNPPHPAQVGNCLLYTSRCV